MVALGVLAILLLVSLGPLHLDSESRSEDHCAICHLRHVSALTPVATLVETSPLVPSAAPVADDAAIEREAYQKLHPSRGPPT
jgi:hypothetical protein